MLSQEKFNKLSKYALRLEKSFVNNNSSDYLKYCSHLKYHIGGDNTQINKMFEELIKLINDKPEYKFDTLTTANADLTNTNTNLTKEKETLTNANANLTKEKETLTNANVNLTNTNADLTNTNANLTKQIERYELDNAELGKQHKQVDDKIKELENNNDELQTANSTLEEKIAKYNGIIEMINSKLDGVKDKNIDDDNYKTELEQALDEFKTRLKEKENMCKTNDVIIEENKRQIDELQKKIVELETKIKEQETTITNLQADLDKSNQEKNDALILVKQSEEANIKALEDLKQTNYLEFKLQLSNLFKAIYPESIANAIIQQMKVGDKVVIPEKNVKPEKVVEQVKTKEHINQELENTEFEIYSAKDNDKKRNILLSKIKLANDQQNKKIKKQFLDEINKILDTEKTLEQKKIDIQQVINNYTKADGLRYTKSGKIQFGGLIN